MGTRERGERVTGLEGMQLLAVLGTAVGAGWDLRTGTIPRWLTLPLLAAGPAIALGLYGVTASHGLLSSCLGICLCGFVPFAAHRQDPDGMGGGDVALFAAAGGLLGPSLGLEAEFYSMVAASIGALVVLAWKRQLMASFANLFFLSFNRILPKKWRRDVSEALRTQLRVGPYIFVGTAAAVLLQHSSLLGLGR